MFLLIQARVVPAVDSIKNGTRIEDEQERTGFASSERTAESSNA
jgi:hypothetical protein